MNNQIQKKNLNHSFIFFLFCNIFSFIVFKFSNFNISPLICLFLILIVGVTHGSLDHEKGRKLFKIFNIKTGQLKVLDADFDTLNYIVLEIISGKFEKIFSKNDKKFIEECIQVYNKD